MLHLLLPHLSFSLTHFLSSASLRGEGGEKRAADFAKGKPRHEAPAGDAPRSTQAVHDAACSPRCDRFFDEFAARRAAAFRRRDVFRPRPAMPPAEPPLFALICRCPMSQTDVVRRFHLLHAHARAKTGTPAYHARPMSRRFFFFFFFTPTAQAMRSSAESRMRQINRGQRQYQLKDASSCRP